MQQHITACAFELALTGAGFGADCIRNVLKDFVSSISSGITENPLAWIGHIKGICLGRDRDYVKISWVSDTHGADITGPWHHNPERIRFIVNIIVTGMPEKALFDLADRAARETEHVHGIEIMRIPGPIAQTP